MKPRDVALVVAALVLLVGGVLLSQRLTSTRQVPAREVAGGLLDLSRQDGELVVDDVQIAIAVAPRPVRPMQPMTLALAFRRGGQPAVVDSPRLSFNMKMDMGPHDYVLQTGPDGRWLAPAVVLPTCPSGGRLWFGTLRFTVDGAPREGRFRLELQPAEAQAAPVAAESHVEDGGPGEDR